MSAKQTHPLAETRNVESPAFRRHKSLFLSNAYNLNAQDIKRLCVLANVVSPHVQPRQKFSYLILDFSTHDDAKLFWLFIHNRKAIDIFKESKFGIYYDKFFDAKTGEVFENGYNSILKASWTINRETKETYYKEAGLAVTPPPPPKEETKDLSTTEAVVSTSPVVVENTNIDPSSSSIPIYTIPVFTANSCYYPRTDWQSPMYLTINSGEKVMFNMVLNGEQYTAVMNLLLKSISVQQH